MSSLLTKVNHGYGKYLLLGIDFAFIAASMVRYRLRFFFNEELLSVGQDGGYAEQFQYVKLMAIILLLGLAALATKSALIGGWAIIFSILLADDKLILHEKWGEKFAEWFSIQPMFYLRAIDYGELMVFAMWGIIAVAILVATSRIDRSFIARQLSKGLLLSLGGLALFGGAFDMLHIAARNFYGLSPRGENLFDALEDGGEMIVVSLALWFIYQIYLKVRFKSKQMKASHQG
ncbi:MAG: hypothetical protein WA885_06385 [Phormidesmis sp.]